CQDGGQRSSQSLNLLVHDQFLDGEMPHKCLEFEKSFSWRFHLIIYQMIHTDERP
ncbi:ZFP2 protein, partial [Hippolais icterina]|nr:ZFP2 protein [Hippolais icterina]